MLNSVASSSTICCIPKAFSGISKSSFNGIQIRGIRSSVQQCPQMKSYRHSASSVVMMAKREEELKEIRDKSTEAINEEVIELKGELLMLRLLKSNGNEFKSSDFRRMRKRVARMLTVKREREIEEGINKRLSRKLDRKWRKSIVPRPPPTLLRLREEEAAEEAEKAKNAEKAA